MSACSFDDNISITLNNNNANVLSLNYGIDRNNKNICSREEMFNNNSIREVFEYDNLDRLIKISEGDDNIFIKYDSEGNIESKSNIGIYKYDLNHSVSSIEDPSELIQLGDIQSITYDEINKVETIEEGRYKQIFEYNINGEQTISKLYFQDDLIETRVYIENIEQVIESDGSTRTLVYNNCPDGILGVKVIDSKEKENNFYYIHTDIIGSWIALSDQHGKIIEKKNFDVWGEELSDIY